VRALAAARGDFVRVRGPRHLRAPWADEKHEVQHTQVPSDEVPIEAAGHDPEPLLVVEVIGPEAQDEQDGHLDEADATCAAVEPRSVKTMDP
jgi:hypothetical protein